MGYSTVALKEKILEMFPEIGKQQLAVDVVYSPDKNAYLVIFTRGSETLATHLETKDADECMNGVKCVYLGVQITQFIKNFAAREEFSRKAA
jgi:hypothetical protein